MSNFSTIICCINLTENNDEIISYTKQIASCDSKILLVHIMPSLSTLKNLAPTIDSFIKDAKENIIKNLEEYKVKYFSEFETETFTLDGLVSNAIIELVEVKCADIIVMGSASKKWIFLGSAPESVLAQNSRIPILLVPNDLDLTCTE